MSEMLALIVLNYRLDYPVKKYFVTNVEAKTENTCPVCLDRLKEPVTSKCNHEFCFVCLINLSQYTCPLCRANLRVTYKDFVLNKNDLHSFSTALHFVHDYQTMEQALAALRSSRITTHRRIRVIIENFYDNMRNDFKVTN